MVLLAGALAMGLGAVALVGCSSTKPEKPREWTEVEKGYVGQWDDGSTLERGTDGGAL